VLKTRIMPTLLCKDFELVKGVGFDSWRCVGSLLQAIRVYEMRGVDELVFLDITATWKIECRISNLLTTLLMNVLCLSQ